MKIVADENIPLIAELFSPLGEVVLLPGREITSQKINDADILLTRSITPVNANLLHNSQVKFVGTATTGTDHIDINWLKDHNIFFADAKGSNATAVAEYVTCCIASLQSRNLLAEKNIRAGIIGIGHVGNKVLEKFTAMNFEILANDPPRAAIEPDFISTPLTAFYDLDIICLHTPLTIAGSFPTYHLINKDFLKKLKPGCILLNAGRGAVINSADLYRYGQHLQWCSDVWEHEPEIEMKILQNAVIATPHIAGYTAEAKLHGALMLYQAAQHYLAFPRMEFDDALFPKIDLSVSSNSSWREILLQVYNPETDTKLMQQTLISAPATDIPKHFDYLRKHYRKRHEFASIILQNGANLKNFDRQLLLQLGFKY